MFWPVDVFCPYGQSYLLYTLGFLFLPKTFHAAALVTTLTNAVYVLCALVILRKLIRNNLVFLILGGTLPIVFWLLYYYNATNTPSHGGLRYLPIMLLGVALFGLEKTERFSPFSIFCFVLSWVWSFEAGVYSTFIYATFLTVRAAMASTSPAEAVRGAARSVSWFFVLIAAVTALVSCVYLITTGGLPRYDLYLSMILAFIGPDPTFTYYRLEPHFFGWIPVLLAYSVALCLVVRQCVLQITGAGRNGDDDWPARLSVAGGPSVRDIASVPR
jgi:hypothetical protein